MLLLIPLLACRESPQAPEDLSELSRYLFREWESEDPEVMRAGLDQLALFMEGVDMDAGVVDRSFVLDEIDDADVADIERPDRPLSNCIQIGIFGYEDYAIDDHAVYMTWEDQRPINDSADVYERTFFDDPSCFPSRDCELIRAEQHQERSNIIYTATYEGRKDFRWVELSDGRWAIAGKGWHPLSWPAEDEDDGWLYQSYDVDLWVETPDGGIWRYYAPWTESTFSDADPDIILGTLRSATDSRYKDEEDAAEEISGE